MDPFLLIRLYFEFFKTGLFSIGGGMATIPFLQHMGESTGWFTNQQLTTMIAVSESTPGPLGINMATYVGFETGSLAATLGVITPGIIIILIIASFLNKFRNNRNVEAVFSGLRPASTALIVSAGLTVAASIFFTSNNLSPDSFPAVRWPTLILAVAAFSAMQWTPLKKLHPICYIAAAAVIGIMFQF